MLLHSLFLLFSLIPWPVLSGQSLGPREFRSLSSAGISQLVSAPDPVKNLDPADPQSHLSRILIPRAPQTENNTMVRKYLISTLQKLQWHIEEDEFTSQTPIGEKKFVNVIATKDPKASRRVILSAHFDSKWFPNFPKNQFVGATDSAAPCAMMLDIAEALNPLLDERADRDDAEDDEDILDTTLQLVFFDGEEAYMRWSDTDSLYGSRHLAEKWESTYVSPSIGKRRLLAPQGATMLSTIEHLILLDLLGAKNPRIQNYFTDTAWLFDQIKDVETRLGSIGHLNYGGENANLQASPYHSFFTPRNEGQVQNLLGIEDDHIPFFRRGVSILHLISNPFPRVWHELSDDAKALDIPTMRRWNIILRVFLSEYLHLRPPEKPTRSDDDSSSPVEESGRVRKSFTELVLTSV